MKKCTDWVAFEDGSKFIFVIDGVNYYWTADKLAKYGVVINSVEI